MRRVGNVLVLALLALCAVCAAGANVRVQMHVSRVVEDDVIEAEFNARSTPGNPQFRQHLTVEQLAKLVRGKPASLAAVSNYLRRIGVTDVSTFATDDVITATVAADSEAARALSVPSTLFGDKAKRAVLATPKELQAHVTRVVAVPTKGAPVKLKDGKKKTKSNPWSLSGSSASAASSSGGGNQEPGAVQTPDTIRTRYNVPATSLTSASVQGVGEFQSSYFNATWISTFTSKYNIVNTPVLVKGPNSVSTDDQEGPLDLQYIIAMAPGTSTWWISSNDSSTVSPANIDFAWWSDEAMKLSPRPTVVSLSWGLGEQNYASDVELLYSDNDAFRKLGLLGISVFVASGDAGPGGRSDDTCTAFDPAWPAASPYVTTVGATYAEAGGNEIAVSWSGGGFSNYFPRPSWQDAAVAQFNKNAGASLPNASLYNASGRGYPDVAALGTNFEVYGDNGMGTIGWTTVSGTSCAAPTFAGIITRINALRVAKGKPTLGFLNPTLYKMGSVGYDVVDGYNTDTDCFGFIPIGGFNATQGWDPITGLGTPKFDVLTAGLMD